MNHSRTISVLIGALSLPLLAACGDDAPEPMADSATGSSSSTAPSQAITPQALIDQATSVVENRVVEGEDVAVEDVIPSEYLEEGENAEVPGQMAAAMLEPTEGNTVKGVVLFFEESEMVENELGEEEEVTRVRIVAEINGLTPGPHGFHIHETGDCSAADASSAGGHFNPQDVAHAGPDAEERHAGDLGNITASAYGESTLDTTDSFLSFEGTNAVVGKAVVVHAGQDDLSTQPSGDAGERVACGVIQTETIGS